jgi:DNA-binding helix-hairpin-helix protein with protein kinase domain
VDAAAPPVLLLRRRATLERLRLDPELEIGAGGEAVVYGVPGDGGLVAKLYHEPTLDRARKLAAMVSNPPAMPAGTAIAWPSDVLLAERGGFAGFLMPRADGPRVFEFYNPVTRARRRRGSTRGCCTARGATWPPPSTRCTPPATWSAT